MICNVMRCDARIEQNIRSLRIFWDCEALQEHKQTTGLVSDLRQLAFYAEKCKVMRLGCTCPDFEYMMADQSGSLVPLEESKSEKDLGVYIDRKTTLICMCMKPLPKKSQQTTWNYPSSLPVLRSRITPLLVERARQASTRVRHCHLVTVPKEGSGCSRGCERRATKMIPSLQDLPYEDQLM